MNYPVQGSLDLKVEKEVEVDGVGMGVLSDGTPYLTGRGLARLCGVDNSVITRLGAEWSEQLQKPRVTRIRQILNLRGINPQTPYLEFAGNKYWTGSVCIAVLEYYALDASQNNNSIALRNYRTLAGRGFEEFIYTQVGYDPSQSVPDQWKQFHDRVSLTYNSVPAGYFSIFKEIADMIVTLGQAGLHIDNTFVPDISVGRIWSSHWKSNNLASTYGDRSNYLHNYPDYFPQAASNPQEPLCYPEAALGEFRRWFREVYIGQGKFKNYLSGQAKAKALPASFSQIALKALKK
ncbi:hypothetical protein [Endozoicomonas ascidiicola]|uniref:hypothetical protein n=1 Tax=Endozoicomonas ascidiicola TaxID=1698521 RepID=UPI00083019C9|nr:hypothetical protein [Endozoicomonas ascidiicola]